MYIIIVHLLVLQTRISACCSVMRFSSTTTDWVVKIALCLVLGKSYKREVVLRLSYFERGGDMEL
jgi:hypothetical protein